MKIYNFWNFKLKVPKYPRNCRRHATLILKVQKNPESATLLLFEGIEGIPTCALFFPLDFEGEVH